MIQHRPNGDLPVTTVRKLPSWQDAVRNEPIDVLAGDPQQLRRFGRAQLRLLAHQCDRLAIAESTRSRDKQPHERRWEFEFVSANEDTQVRVISGDQLGDRSEAAHLTRIRLKLGDNVAGHDEDGTPTCNTCNLPIQGRKWDQCVRYAYES